MYPEYMEAHRRHRGKIAGVLRVPGVRGGPSLKVICISCLGLVFSFILPIFLQ